MNEALFAVEIFLEQYSAFKPSTLRKKLTRFLNNYTHDELANKYQKFIEDLNAESVAKNPRPSKRLKNNDNKQDEVMQPYSPYHPKLFLHTLDNAVIRFLFRNPYFGMHMRRVAGKLLKKQEVCNKPGAYSAKVQRNDITQEVNEALDQFCRVLQEDVMQECMNRVNEDNFLLEMCFDHRGLPMYDDMLITTI